MTSFKTSYVPFVDTASEWAGSLHYDVVNRSFQRWKASKVLIYFRRLGVHLRGPQFRVKMENNTWLYFTAVTWRAVLCTIQPFCQQCALHSLFTSKTATPSWTEQPEPCCLFTINVSLYSWRFRLIMRSAFKLMRWLTLILHLLNVLKPTGHVMHQQFNIQQLHVLPTVYLCVLYLSENKQRLVSLTA